MCAKIFQKLLFYKIFKFFIDNNLILLKKSCFKPGDCCTNQPLSITHDIYKSFDWSYETRGVFLEFLEALKFGTMVPYLNWNKMVCLENHTNFCTTS